MVEAPVGFHCPVCVDQARRSRPTPRTTFGAKAGIERPLVTISVIVVCAVIYLFQILPIYSSQLATSLPDITRQFAYAPIYTSEIGLNFEPWRMLTSALLHSPQQAAHLFFNMIALWFVGRAMEPEIGRLRFGALLLLSAFGGSVAVMYWSDPLTPTVGASGAVFGLFGALFVLLRSSGSETGGVVALLAINMVFSFLVPQISWQGHLGGLVTGAVVATVYAYAPKRQRGLWQSLGLILIAALLLLATWWGIPQVTVF
ncbi:rhomboid family intramembrane serine protease [Nesterenkonia sedimenti]|nr:rhomboid family intramembrane serine protease [Nesterenkonia sedimenti]